MGDKLLVKFAWSLRSQTPTNVVPVVKTAAKPQSKAFKIKDAERKRKSYVPVGLRSEQDQKKLRVKNLEAKKRERAKKRKEKSGKKFSELDDEEKRAYFREKMKSSRAKKRHNNSETEENRPSKCQKMMTPEDLRKYHSARKREHRRKKAETPSTCSRATYFRRVLEVKSKVPKSPQKFAKCVASLLNDATPRKVSALKNKGIRISDEADNIIADNVKAAINMVKKKPTNRNRDILYKLVKYGSGNRWKIGRKLGASYKVWRKIINDKLEVKKARLKGCISEKTKDDVEEFWLTEVSRPVPLKKRVKRKVASHLLECSYMSAFTKFKRKYPNTKIGYVKFIQFKPKNVRHMKALERIVCCCIKCENIKLTVRALNKQLRHDERLQTDPDEIAKWSMCAFEEEHSMPKPDCIFRKCVECGLKKVDELNDIIKENGVTGNRIKYEQWERVLSDVKVRTGEIKKCSKIEPVTHEGTMSDVLEILRKQIPPHSAHMFRAKWQQQQLKKAKQNMRPHSAIIIMDFAENYKCTCQDEVQPAHWSQNSATLHPAMAFINTSDKIGPAMHKESLITVSDDLKHDVHAVARFMKLSYKYLQDKFEINHVEQFTDCCAAQYRSCKCLAQLSLSQNTYSITVNHNYFESSHGKSSSDGLGAVVKFSATKAVTRRQYSIANAKELYNFCMSELGSVGQSVFRSETQKYANSGRKFFYVSKEEIERDRPEVDVKQVPGILGIHCIQSSGRAYQVKMRNLSCFCQHCQFGEGSACSAHQYMVDWKPVSLQLKGSAQQTDKVESDHADNVSEDGDADLDDAYSESEAGDTMIIKCGCFVAVRVHGDRKQHIYFGQVEEVQDDAQIVTVNFLQTSSSAAKVFSWPKPEQIEDHAISAVIRVMGIPETVNFRRNQVAFDKQEMKDALDRL